MNKVKRIIKDMLEKLNKKYSTDEIENLIYDSIVILVCKELKLASDCKKILPYPKEEILKISQHQIYKILNKNLPKSYLKKDSLLPSIYEYLVSKEEKKEKYSIYYTPNWLVKYIVDNSLKTIFQTKKEIEKIKILEPSCGGGMFLIYVFDVLLKWYKDNTNFSIQEIIKNIIEDNIYGNDIDSRSLKISTYTLKLKCLKEASENLDLKFNLYNMDFLKKGKLDRLSFDLIVGNPPYLENRRINKYFDKNDLKKRYNTAIGRFDIYSLFIEKSIELLKNSGYLTFVLPGNLLTNNNFYPIRKLILQKTHVKEIVNLGDGIFESVSMNMVIIALNKVKKIKKDNLIKCKNIKGTKKVENEITSTKYKYIPQFYYNNIIKHVFDIDSSETTFKLREKIFIDGYTKINDVCEIIAGIATGNIRKKLLTRDGSSYKTKKVLEGKNIIEYFHKWDGLYIVDDKTLIDKSKGEYATFMRKKFITDEKILVRQTADRFICTYDNEKYYLLNTLYSLRIRDEYKGEINIKYILGLLNSDFYSFLYKSIVKECGKIFPQVKIFHIQNSPIIIPDKSIQDRIAKKVDEIINIKKEINSKKFLDDFKATKMKSQIIELKREVNSLVYNIFRLQENEILEVKMNMTNY